MANRYWKGGASGDINNTFNTLNWSSTSGGTGGAGIPGSGDAVYLDAGGNSYDCTNTGVLNCLSFTKQSTFTKQLSNGGTIQSSGTIAIRGSSTVNFTGSWIITGNGDFIVDESIVPYGPRFPIGTVDMRGNGTFACRSDVDCYHYYGAYSGKIINWDTDRSDHTQSCQIREGCTLYNGTVNLVSSSMNIACFVYYPMILNNTKFTGPYTYVTFNGQWHNNTSCEISGDFGDEVGISINTNPSEYTYYFKVHDLKAGYFSPSVGECVSCTYDISNITVNSSTGMFMTYISDVPTSAVVPGTPIIFNISGYVDSNSPIFYDRGDPGTVYNITGIWNIIGYNTEYDVWTPMGTNSIINIHNHTLNILGTGQKIVTSGISFDQVHILNSGVATIQDDLTCQSLKLDEGSCLIFNDNINVRINKYDTTDWDGSSSGTTTLTSANGNHWFLHNPMGMFVSNMNISGSIADCPIYIDDTVNIDKCIRWEKFSPPNIKIQQSKVDILPSPNFNIRQNLQKKFSFPHKQIQQDHTQNMVLYYLGKGK